MEDQIGEGGEPEARVSPPLEPHERANLKAARVTAGLTQAQLAELIGLSDAFVSMLETGKSGPSMTTLRRIASACRVDLAWLFVQRGAVPVGQPLQRFIQELDDDGRDLSEGEMAWLQWITVPGRRMTTQAYAHALALYSATREDR
jgi:transcriptional regulator with XRE-family HTH domain